MTTHFLFPTHPLKATAVEEMFADQLSAVRESGYSASLSAGLRHPEASRFVMCPSRRRSSTADDAERGGVWAARSGDRCRVGHTAHVTDRVPRSAPPSKLVSPHRRVHAGNARPRFRCRLGVGIAVAGLGSVLHQRLREVAEDLARLHRPRPVGDRCRGRRDGAIQGRDRGRAVRSSCRSIRHRVRAASTLCSTATRFRRTIDLFRIWCSRLHRASRRRSSQSMSSRERTGRCVSLKLVTGRCLT